MALKDYELHKGMMVSCMVTGIGIFLMGYGKNLIFLSLTTLVFSIGMVFLDVFMNICMIRTGEKDVKKYLTLGYFMNSCGNFLGPFFSQHC